MEKNKTTKTYVNSLFTQLSSFECTNILYKNKQMAAIRMLHGFIKVNKNKNYTNSLTLNFWNIQTYVMQKLPQAPCSSLAIATEMSHKYQLLLQHEQID